MQSCEYEMRDVLYCLLVNDLWSKRSFESGGWGCLLRISVDGDEAEACAGFELGDGGAACS